MTTDQTPTPPETPNGAAVAAQAPQPEKAAKTLPELAPLDVVPGELSLATLRTAYLAPFAPKLARGWLERVASSAATVDAIVARGDPAYGINTGFGKLAQTHIAARRARRTCSAT